jgi:ABC-2 type transport system ATP-binding protein
VIIDEPMVGLDPIHARVVKDELKARSRAGTTVFMSTHLLNVAEELADRVGIIHRGQLVALGAVEDLKRARPGDQPGRAAQLEEVFMALVEADFGDASGAGALRH